METKSPLQIGDKVPTFSLRDQNQEKMKLSDFLGNRVLLSFHPLAWTPVCRDQVKGLEANSARFHKHRVKVFSLSVDSVPCKKAWADSLGIENLRLLCDFWPHGQVAGRFGLFREQPGFSERANLLIDAQGCLEWRKIYDIPQLPDLEEIFAFLEQGA